MNKHLIKPPTAAAPCAIHRTLIPSSWIDGKPHIFPLRGITRILKVDTKDGGDMNIWYMSSPERTEGSIELWIFPTGAQVPNHLSYVGTVIWQTSGLVWHVFVNPQSFPKDRPYISH